MPDLTRKGLKLSHLRFAATLAKDPHITAAAAQLGITQPAASRLAAEIEAITGAPLYRRSGRGIALTHEGQALARRAERVLHEIRAAARDISELSAGVAGNVRVGAVTGPALEHLLPTIQELRVTRPRIRLEIEVATSDQLCSMVRDGHLDFALARLPASEGAVAFDYVHLDTEPLSLIARSAHPVGQETGPLSMRRLLQYDWVLPESGKILTTTVESTLRERGMDLPKRTLNTSSFLLTLAAVMQTDSIAVVATSVARLFSAGAEIRILDVDCDFVVDSYGVIKRHGALLSPAAREIEKAMLSRFAETRG